jgi:hypothetical protein
MRLLVCWCLRNLEMNDFAPSMVHDDQYVAHTSRHGRNDKEIHGGNAARMILEKGPPALGGGASGPGAILSDRGRRDF